MNILLIRPKPQTSLALALEAALGRSLPRRNLRELTFDQFTSLVKFRYQLREAYHDVEGVVYVEGEDNVDQWYRMCAVAAFCGQQQVPMVLVSRAAVNSNTVESRRLREVAEHIELTVSRHFVVGQAPIDTDPEGLSGELAKLFDLAWYGRYHLAQTPAGQMGLVEMGRKHAL